MKVFFNRMATATILTQTGTKIFRHDPSSEQFYNIEFESEFGSKNLSGKVKLWNIARPTLHALRDSVKEKKQGASITVNAGYDGDLGLILSGDVIGMTEGTDGADRWIEASVTNSNMLYFLITKTWGKVTVSSIVSDIASMLGLIPDIRIEKDITLPSFAGKGNAIQTLRALAAIAVDKDRKPARFSQEIRQGGKLQFYSIGRPEPNAVVITLDASSGLIGRPMLKSASQKKVWLVKSLLQHRIVHGAKIQIRYNDAGRSATINGTISGGKHRGGTYSEEFITEVDVGE